MEPEQKVHLFELQVRRDVATPFPEAAVSVTVKERYRLKIRIEIGQETFIDIFYNPRNDRTDFSLIRKSRRVFGYDNLGGWHCHPANDPDGHMPCSEPRLPRVLQEMKAILNTL